MEHLQQTTVVVIKTICLFQFSVLQINQMNCFRYTERELAYNIHELIYFDLVYVHVAILHVPSEWVSCKNVMRICLGLQACFKGDCALLTNTIGLFYSRDVPTMFSVLHPLDEPRPITSKVQGNLWDYRLLYILKYIVMRVSFPFIFYFLGNNFWNIFYSLWLRLGAKKPWLYERVFILDLTFFKEIPSWKGQLNSVGGLVQWDSWLKVFLSTLDCLLLWKLCSLLCFLLTKWPTCPNLELEILNSPIVVYPPGGGDPG